MLRAMIAPVCQKRAHKKTENFFVYGSKTKEIMPALAPDEGTLELKLDWRNAPKVLEALLSQEVRTFLDSCKSAGRCLIQIKPFVPFPSGQPGPVDFTLLGVAVPDYAKSPDWGDLNCKEMSAGGPSFKTWCSRFPNPKIFVEVVSCKQMYGFGAYIEWLRENATKMDAVAYGRKALGHAHRAERHVERGNVQAARLHYGRVVRYAKLARSAPGSGGILSAVERAESVARNVAGAIKRTVTPERLGTLAGLAAVGVTGALLLGSLRGPVSGGSGARAREAYPATETYLTTTNARRESDTPHLAIASARNTGKTADNLALHHLTALIELMLKVFGTDTSVRVHNLDVKYFHIKRA